MREPWETEEPAVRHKYGQRRQELKAPYRNGKPPFHRSKRFDETPINQRRPEGTQDAPIEQASTY